MEQLNIEAGELEERISKNITRMIEAQ